MPASAVADGRGAALRADCERCFGLCCVAPALSASADFAIDKPAGQPCPNLRRDFRCAIHDELRPRGFPGCTAFDCFGAGQKVAQQSFGGVDWRQAPDTAAQMFAVFGIMRQLHELLWYLTDALTRAPARALVGELNRAVATIQRLTEQAPAALAGLDVNAPRAAVNTLLLRVSELVRAEVGRPARELRGADLMGQDLRRTHLRGANLRGAYLIAADLRGVDLGYADLIGADLRGADVRGADLADSLFLTQSQVGAAKGDLDTRLPASLTRPSQWSA